MIEKTFRGKVTHEMALKILEIARENPKLSFRKLAAICKVGEKSIARIIRADQAGEPLTPKLKLTSEMRELINRYNGVFPMTRLAEIFKVESRVIDSHVTYNKVPKNPRAKGTVQIVYQGKVYEVETSRAKPVERKKRAKSSGRDSVSPAFPNLYKQKQTKNFKEERGRMRPEQMQTAAQSIEGKVPVTIGKLTVYAYPDKVEETIKKYLKVS